MLEFDYIWKTCEAVLIILSYLPFWLFLSLVRSATLQQLSTRIPRKKDELLEITGIGNIKVTKYGDRVLETIEATLRDYYNKDKNSSASNDSNGSKRKLASDVPNGNSNDDDFIPSRSKKRFPSSVKAKSGLSEATPAKGSVSLVNPTPTSLPMDSPPHPNPEVDLDLSNKLLESLKMLRIIFVKEAGERCLAYHIFTNATLQQLSMRMPRNKDELQEINGISKAKITKYGDRVLETIEATLRDYQNKDMNSSSNGIADSERRQANSVPNGNVANQSENAVPVDHTHPAYDDQFEEIEFDESLLGVEVTEANKDISDKLLDSLRTLRTILTKEAGERCMAYHIFTNATMRQICERIPKSKDELLEINGIGNIKVTKYGDRVLETIEATLRDHFKKDKNSSSSNDTTDMDFDERLFDFEISEAD